MMRVWGSWVGVVAGFAMVAGCSDPAAPNPSGNGRVLWSVPAGSVSTEPLILGPLLIFGDSEGGLQALDRRTGEVAWTRPLVPGYSMRGDRIATAGDLILVPLWDLWALDAHGSLRWRFGGPDGAAGTRNPVVSGDTVFTGSEKGWASAVDARSGQPYWSVDLEESTGPPALSEELVVFGTRHVRSRGPGHLIALRRSDGSEVWRVVLPDSAGFPGFSGAETGGVVWQDRVIVGSGPWVYAVSLEDGTVLWKTPNGSSPNLSSYPRPPVMVEDVAVLGRQNSGVEGWDVRSGDLLWNWDVPSGTYDLVGRGGLVYAIEGLLTIGDASGAVLWQRGRSQPFDEAVSFRQGVVAPGGTIYVVRSSPYRGAGAWVEALLPPVTP